MAHSHSHAHAEDESNYFLDQICTVAACGAVGAVAILYFLLTPAPQYHVQLRSASGNAADLTFAVVPLPGQKTERLGLILTESFWIWVLLGGIALAVLALVRGISLWQLASRVRAAEGHEHEHNKHDADCAHAHGDDCGHDHAHGHAHSHSHAEHSHSHAEHSHNHAEHSHSHAEHSHNHDHGDDDGHAHSWAPWRYIVLLLPVALFAFNMPNQGYSLSRLQGDLKKLELEGNARIAKALVFGGTFMGMRRYEPATLMRFNELAMAALSPQRREHFEGKMVKLKGMFAPVTDNEFQLFRIKMTCCAADAIPLKALIVSPVPIQTFQPRQWIEVEGELTFRKVAGKNEWAPVIQLDSDKQIKAAEPDNNEYEDL